MFHVAAEKRKAGRGEGCGGVMGKGRGNTGLGKMRTDTHRHTDTQIHTDTDTHAQTQTHAPSPSPPPRTARGSPVAVAGAEMTAVKKTSTPRPLRPVSPPLVSA